MPRQDVGPGVSRVSGLGFRVPKTFVTCPRLFISKKGAHQASGRKGRAGKGREDHMLQGQERLPQWTEVSKVSSHLQNTKPQWHHASSGQPDVFKFGNEDSLAQRHLHFSSYGPSYLTPSCCPDLGCPAVSEAAGEKLTTPGREKSAQSLTHGARL